MIDAWSAGHYGNEPPEDKGKRLVRALCWVRSEPRDNGYARPDREHRRGRRPEPQGAGPGRGLRRRAPAPSGRATGPATTSRRRGPASSRWRSCSPRGRASPSSGHEVRWQKWTFRVGFNPREGLVLHTVGYDGRPVLYRASIAEMMVPYADPRRRRTTRTSSTWASTASACWPTRWRSAATAWARSATSTPTWPTAAAGPSRSRTRSACTRKTPACSGSTPTGATGQSEVRRSRRLAVSMVATVGNYDYGFYWYFYQDGTIQMEVKLTGIVNTTGARARRARPPRHRGRAAAACPYHQHYFNARLDLAVDGEDNTVEEVNTREPAGRPRQPLQQRLRRRGDARSRRSRRPSATPTRPRRGSGGSSTPAARTPWAGRWRYRLCPGRDHAAVCPARRVPAQAGGLPDPQPLGDPVRPEGAVPGRRLPQPEPRRRRPAPLDEGRPRPRRPRPGRLVHLRPDPHPPA